MSKRLTRKDILTIPNAMSFLRLALIPLYLWLYVKQQQYGWALGVLVLSALTDVFDGRIARQFDQVTDVGKVLDPLADKLTQAALIISLADRYPRIWLLFGLFAVKEIIVAVTGVVVFVRTDTVKSAKWFGKLSTFVLEFSMGILIVFPVVSPALATALPILSGALLVFAGASYIITDIRMIREHKKNKTENEADAA